MCIQRKKKDNLWGRGWGISSQNSYLTKTRSHLEESWKWRNKRISITITVFNTKNQGAVHCSKYKEIIRLIFKCCSIPEPNTSYYRDKQTSTKNFLFIFKSLTPWRSLPITWLGNTKARHFNESSLHCLAKRNGQKNDLEFPRLSVIEIKRKGYIFFGFSVVCIASIGHQPLEYLHLPWNCVIGLYA